MDQDEMLREMRRAIIEWERAEPGSRAEQEAAERATSAAAGLDKHLMKGGALPVPWRSATPPWGSAVNEAAGTCTHGADCLVHPLIQGLHGDLAAL